MMPKNKFQKEALDDVPLQFKRRDDKKGKGSDKDDKKGKDSSDKAGGEDDDNDDDNEEGIQYSIINNISLFF